MTGTGTLYTWGKNGDGQLGHGDRKMLMSPRLVEALEGAFVTDAATRGAHVMAVSADGRLYTWGRGDEGQLGHGQRNDEARHQIPRVVDRLKQYPPSLSPPLFRCLSIS